jgi:hypothetical protein
VEEVGLVRLPETPPPERTEAIQHGIFKYGIIPVGLYGALAGIMWLNHRKHPEDHPGIGEVSDQPAGPGPGGEVRR